MSFLAVVHCLRTLSLVAFDLVRLVTLAARRRAALVAENLFLRKQLALFQERKVWPSINCSSFDEIATIVTPEMLQEREGSSP